VKFEIRNPKFETISNFKCSKFKKTKSELFQAKGFLLRGFGFWLLGFFSDFDIRISDFMTNLVPRLFWAEPHLVKWDYETQE